MTTPSPAFPFSASSRKNVKHHYAFDLVDNFVDNSLDMLAPTVLELIVKKERDT